MPNRTQGSAPARLSIVEDLDAFEDALASASDPLGDGRPFPGGPYTDYRIWLRFEMQLHKAILPEQKPGGLTHIVQLAAPTTILRMRWVAERVGEPPEPPPWELGDGNSEMIEAPWWDPITPHLDPDGVTMVYGTAGQYAWAFRDPAKVKYGAAMLPWIAEACGRGHQVTIYDGPQLFDAQGNGVDWRQELRNWKRTRGGAGKGSPKP